MRDVHGVLELRRVLEPAADAQAAGDGAAAERIAGEPVDAAFRMVVAVRA